MSLETQELRSIIHTSRSLRYAFIVDPESADISKQLNDIFQFSFNMWGGRLNAIIPLIGEDISQSWWEVFKICDPDIVISCIPLSEELICKIHKNICPAEISFISDEDLILTHRQCPISVFEIPRFQEKNPTYGKRKKYYCIKSNKACCSSKNHKFIEVNFGCYRDNILVTESFKSVNSKEILLSDELDIKSFIDAFSSFNEEKPIFPIDVCGIYAPKLHRPEYNYNSSNLQIIIGNSPSDLIYFWNRHLYTGGHDGRDTVWIPPELFDDEDTIEKIGKWISSNYYGGNNGACPAAYVVSFSVDNLNEYVEKLKRNFPKVGIKTKKMSLESIPSLVVYPMENSNEIANDLTFSKRVIIENGSFSLSPNNPPFYYSDGSRFTNSFFAVDLKLEHKPKQFVNRTEIIQVPQRYGLSFAFFGYPPITSRINKAGHPTRIVETNSNYIDVSIPNIQKILNGYKYDFPKNFEPISIHSLDLKFHLSDSEEGKELKRLIDLFGDLNSFGHFLEDHFLVKFAYELSNIKNMNDENRHKLKKLNRVVTTLAEIISPDTTLSQNQNEACVDLLNEKLNVFYNKPNKEYSLNEIEKLFGQLKSDAIKKGKDVNFWSSYKNFKDFHLEQFNFYYNKKIFLQGFRQSCSFCSHEDWYPMSHNGKIYCNACASPYQVEIFPEFKIRLNDLFAKALKKNSYVYVAWALYHLQRDSFKSSYFYYHSQDIFAVGEQSALTDLDFIIIKDRKLGIGEVKADPCLFLKNQTLEKLEKAVNLILPDEVYLCAPSKEPWPENVINEINKFKERLATLGIDTIIYSVPPLVEWADSKIINGAKNL